MDKSVTIIIPAWNGAKTLPQCLNSIINQHYQNFKVIVVNDASTDNTVEIVQEFIKKDRRISLIDNKVNGGPSVARNCGLKNLDTDFFTFIDCDDWIEPNYISTLVNLHDENTVMTTCRFRYEKRSERHLKNKKQIVKQFNIDDALCELITDKNIFGIIATKMYKTSMLKDLVFDEKLLACEDANFNIHYVLQNYNENATVKCSNQRLYHYVQTKGSLSSMSCNAEKYYKQKTLFDVFEALKTIPRLKENPEFCSRINSWIFLMSLQFAVFSKKIKKPEEIKNFKTLAKKYLPDYKKQRKNYSSFRAHGVLLYNLIKMFIW